MCVPTHPKRMPQISLRFAAQVDTQQLFIVAHVEQTVVQGGIGQNGALENWPDSHRDFVDALRGNIDSGEPAFLSQDEVMAVNGDGRSVGDFRTPLPLHGSRLQVQATKASADHREAADVAIEVEEVLVLAIKKVAFVTPQFLVASIRENTQAQIASLVTGYQHDIAGDQWRSSMRGLVVLCGEGDPPVDVAVLGIQGKRDVSAAQTKRNRLSWIVANRGVEQLIPSSVTVQTVSPCPLVESNNSGLGLSAADVDNQQITFVDRAGKKRARLRVPPGSPS